MPSDLAKKFADYISDDLPPEIQTPDAIELGNALIKAEAEIERLREALEPFAEIAKEIQPVCKDSGTISLAWADPKVGDFRRALAALTPDKGAV